jgi:hypothetical protein
LVTDTIADKRSSHRQCADPDNDELLHFPDRY